MSQDRHPVCRSERERGTALVLAVVALVIVTMFATALLTGYRQTKQRAGDSERQLICANLAEAGLDKAIAELRANPDAYRGEADTMLGRGTFSVEVLPSATPGQFEIRSTGAIGGGAPARAQIVATVAFDASGQLRALRWEDDQS